MTTGFAPSTLPYAVFSVGDGPMRVGVGIGDEVLDLSAVDVPNRTDFAAGSLNAFLARGRAVWQANRARIVELTSHEARRPELAPHLRPQREVRLHLPFEVADYVDFYSSEHHATNVGRLFRPGQEPLTANWRHLPIGYHGRAGTVVVSGTTIVRPRGQYREADSNAPVFGPTQRLDFEAEVGFVVGVPSRQGEPVPIDRFADHVFGVVLVNDWSARDIQGWESAPLGPFLGKSFATSISPWVIPLDALAAARVPTPDRPVELLPYLRETEPWGLDLTLEVRLNEQLIARPPYRQMGWTPAQQLAHLTVNGASLRTGDLYASGTVSGPADDELGSLLEISRNGDRPLRLPDGSVRTFLEDGDEVTISATAQGPDGAPVFLGEVCGVVLA